jgi:hypothetical protein
MPSRYIHWALLLILWARQVFIDDFLGDRLWVDSDSTKLFVDNLMQAFGAFSERYWRESGQCVSYFKGIALFAAM